MQPASALLIVLWLAPALGAQRPAPASAPADAWRQFRGTANLTGVSASMPPATLKVLWTYDTKDVIDSSAAIVDGVVYVGGGNGDLLALDLASGKLRWKDTTGNLIGESSPAVGNGVVYIGDLGGLLHAVNIKDGSRLWTFQSGSEIKSSPVIAGDVVLAGSYDSHLTASTPRPASRDGRYRPTAWCMPLRPSRTELPSSPAAIRFSARSA